MHLCAVLVPAALLLFASPSAARLLQQQEQQPDSTASGVASYEWHVQLGVAAPDCFERVVIMVANGTGPAQFMPTLEVTQGDMLEVGGCPPGI